LLSNWSAVLLHKNLLLLQLFVIIMCLCYPVIFRVRFEFNIPGKFIYMIMCGDVRVKRNYICVRWNGDRCLIFKIICCLENFSRRFIMYCLPLYKLHVTSKIPIFRNDFEISLAFSVMWGYFQFLLNNTQNK
jgi:hypothetical protein